MELGGRLPAFDGGTDVAGASPIDEMAFLAEVAHMAATARTWDDLMGTVIDRAKAASRADVCSLYLTDRDGSGLTLAATNGLDHEAVGLARLRMGQGITGIAARDQQTVTSPDVHHDPRFAWIRGVDQARFTSMCAVPLVWGEQVVGVLNVQTIEAWDFSPATISFLETLAGLLAGLVEKSRLQAEAEAQVESLARHRRSPSQPGGRGDARPAYPARSGSRVRRAAWGRSPRRRQ